jgi:translation initiation factor IF-3
LKRPRINNQIKAPTVRVIDETGKNLGIFKTPEALNLAKEKNLDLIEVSPKANPVVAKIMDFGKFLYREKRKIRKARVAHKSEMRHIRIRLGTSEHDLAMKAKKVSGFLKEGDGVRIELFLRGREKYLDRGFLRKRLLRILALIPEDYKLVEDFKKSPRGYFITINKA